ncbi:protein of unknown function [Aminobacter niigataensis]|nr:protein of unknown function [Aminobacter niigataensis]
MGHEPHVGIRRIGLDEAFDRGLIEAEFATALRTDHVAKLKSEQTRILCSRGPGPSRYERRRANQNPSHLKNLPQSRYLGDFDSRCKRLAPAPTVVDDTLAKDLASLAWLCAFLVVVAFVVGAL